MGQYSFYDELTLELRGESNVIDDLRDTYQYFETDRHEPADIVCEPVTEEPTPDVVLGGEDEYYGRAGDDFVIKERWGEQLVISRDWDRIAVSSETVHHHAAYVIEFELRKRLASRGEAMIHASGVRIDGRTLVFPAWRHAGKTNTMLSLLRSGGDYLSDDRLWVSADGSALGYPLPINVVPSNRQSFDGLADVSRLERLRADLSDFVFEQVDMERSLVDKMVYFLTKYYLAVEPESALVPVDDLVPDAEFVPDPVSPAAIVLLRTDLDPSEGNGVEIDAIGRDEALTDIANVNFYEWNERLMEYFTAYDMLFPGGNRSVKLEGLIDEETRIVSSFLDRIPTYRAMVPRSRDWAETGIEASVVEQLDRLKRSASPTGIN